MFGKPLFSNWIPRRRRRPTEVIAPEKLIPVRNEALEWELDEDEVSLTVPRRKGLMSNVVARVFRLPETRRVVLDDVGSFVWQLCDGENSVKSIVNRVAAEYCLNRREAETSVSVFLKTLAERNYIGVGVKGGKGAGKRRK